MRMKLKTLWLFGARGILDKLEFLTFHICQVRVAVNPSNVLLKNFWNQNHPIKHYFYFILKKSLSETELLYVKTLAQLQ